MGGEGRPPDDPEEAEERDRDGPRLPEEGGQAVAKRARGGVAGTAASFVSGIAAFTRREQDGIAGLAARGAWAPAEEDLKAFAPFTMGADAADSIKHGYGLVECYGRLSTTRLLLPPDLLKGQTRLLLNKLPDTIPKKRVVIKAFFQESRSGVPRWETLHAVIKDVALMLVPDAPFAPVVNAAFTPRGCWICAATGHSARECTETCSECNFKFCPAAKPGTPRAPCAVNASAAPVAHKITNALGGRLPDVIRHLPGPARSLAGQALAHGPHWRVALRGGDQHCRVRA